MNIAMEQAEEYVNGQLKAKYGDCFIRGNNGKSTRHTAIPEQTEYAQVCFEAGTSWDVLESWMTKGSCC